MYSSKVMSIYARGKLADHLLHGMRSSAMKKGTEKGISKRVRYRDIFMYLIIYQLTISSKYISLRNHDTRLDFSVFAS